jgi:excisionase family DNA binding protein
MIKLHDVKSVSGMLGLSASCIYKKAERGEIQAFKIGTALRFSEENIQEYLEKCKTGKTQSDSGQAFYSQTHKQQIVNHN